MSRALLASLLVLALPSAAAGADPQATLVDIEDEVMCPVCGTPLNQAQGAPQANRERAFIRRLIAQGDSKQEIKRKLVAQYGPQVLATPQGHGFQAASWLVPAGVGAAALALLTLAVARWRRRSVATAAVPEPLAPAEARRLDEDLARYDR